MDSIKKALNKGFDKATNVKDEPQVLNKSSQSHSHALNITSNINDRLEKPQQDPSRSLGAGAVGTTTATGVSTSGTQQPRQ